jgi:hypothetical protein
MTAFCSHNSYRGNNTIDRLFNDGTCGSPFSFDNMGNVFIDALLATYFHAGFLLGLFFNPEDGGGMFLRDFG